MTDPAFSLEVKKAASVGMHLYAVVFTLEGGGGSNNAAVRFQSQEPCLPDVVLFFYYERTTTTSARNDGRAAHRLSLEVMRCKSIEKC